MESIIEQFAYYLSEKRGLTINTVNNYCHDVSAFNDFLSAGNVTIIKSGEQNIKSYLKVLEDESMKKSTVARALAALKAFYSFLAEEGKINSNPAANVKSEKVVRRVPRILSREEVNALICAPSLDSANGLRDRAMLEVLYATGIKVSQLVDMNFSDPDVNLKYIRVYSKDKERLIPLYDEAARILKKYINKRKKEITDESEPLFTNRNGSRISRQGFWKIIKKYAKAAGIETEITPSVLRHSFAAHLVENGAALKDVKEMLGHADISTTLVYSGFVNSHLAAAYKLAHPKSAKK